MRITVVIRDQRIQGRIEHPEARSCVIARCPACGATKALVSGTGITHHNHNTYFAPARTLCCQAPATIEAKVDTLFGIDEDLAVLVHGRPRVY